MRDWAILEFNLPVSGGLVVDLLPDTKVTIFSPAHSHVDAPYFPEKGIAIHTLHYPCAITPINRYLISHIAPDLFVGLLVEFAIFQVVAIRQSFELGLVCLRAPGGIDYSSPLKSYYFTSLVLTCNFINMMIFS